MGFTKHCALNSAGTPVAVDSKTVQLWESFPR
jgi:acyl-CoA thioester hydrolase